MSSPDRKTETPPFRVLIAGGGVAALEALLALRELAGDRVSVTLLSPDPEFRHRPLSVTQPFGLAAARNLDLLDVANEQQAHFIQDGLAEVFADRRQIRTTAGHELDYDALLIAIGARGADGVPGATTFTDSADGDTFRSVLAGLAEEGGRRLVFAVPGAASWPLGLYELALLTSAHARDRDLSGVELTIVTHEAHPMAIFGARASGVVGELIDQAGVELVLGTRPLRFEDGKLSLAGGEAIECDRVISLPVPKVIPIAGIDQQPGGFIQVDRYDGLLGAERVFAAGDATSFPVKQGGLATQQADCAASAIAALAGAAIDPQPFQPVLRGALLTEWGPRYLRTHVDKTAAGTAARSALWWPPGKVAGKYLAPYLATKAGYPSQARPLTDLEPPHGDDGSGLGEEHDDVVALALSSAKANARSRDYPGALRWLEVAENLELYLPDYYEQRRIAWRELARSG